MKKGKKLITIYLLWNALNKLFPHSATAFVAETMIVA